MNRTGTFSIRRATAVFLAVLPVASACSADRPSPNADVADRIRRVETGLLTRNVVGETSHTIDERLRFYRVPGVSVAVIEGGRIAWARGWREVETGSRARSTSRGTTRAK